MKKLTFYLLLIGVATLTYSQSNYKDGFIINKSNNTITGRIDYNSNSANSKFCKFKRSNSDKSIKYTPFQIKAYGYKDGRFYESFRISFNNDSINVFLECLVKGNISLYKFKSNFYVKKGKLYDISEKSIKIKKENGEEFIKKSTYNKGILTYLVSDKIDSKKSVQKLRFNHRSLTNFIENYNNSGDSKSKTFNNSKPFSVIEAGLIAGVSYSKINFSSSSDSFDYLTKAEYTNTYFSYGLGLNLSYPRISERVSLSVELTKQNIGYSANTNSKGISSSTFEDTKLKQEALKLNAGINYHFIKYKIKPFINLGVGAFFNTDIKNNSTITSKHYTTVNIFDRYDVFKPEKRYYFITAGFGASCNISKNISVKSLIKYEGTSSVGNYTYLSSPARYFSFMTGIYYKL